MAELRSLSKEKFRDDLVVKPSTALKRFLLSTKFLTKEDTRRNEREVFEKIGLIGAAGGSSRNPDTIIQRLQQLMMGKKFPTISERKIQ